MIFAINKCRVCNNTDLRLVVDLGIQYLTGVFPRSVAPQSITKGPLELVKCFGGNDVCGLVQLRHSFPATEMYGETYGYRSGLNASMVKHLQAKVSKIEELILLNSDSLVVDIGSNDGTTLASYKPGPRLIGIDPAARKYSSYYPDHIEYIPDFFSADLIRRSTSGKLVTVITSFAMMYDLEDPVSFAKEVASILHQDGIWVFEQSYLPLMIKQMAYDTICHEHIEYYGLRQINWILRSANLRIVDVEFNEINGGSFSVIATPIRSGINSNSQKVDQLIDRESSLGYTDLETLLQFSKKVSDSKTDLLKQMEQLTSQRRRIIGLGASTKGNVLLQYAGLDSSIIESIGDVNPDKWGCFTPGSWIPIVSETEALDRNPDLLFVLPWHFRDFFMSSPNFVGRKLIFPLPTFEIQER
jgi:NDP-4-keto-2,6-dideoxyhexose 3-C-methyltransferase